MAEIIESGAGNGRFPAKVGSDNRLWSYCITEPIGSERSLKGDLYGIGTGSITVTSSFNNGMVLWLKNDDPDNLFQIDKIIYGWNGGSTNYDRTVFCLISYQISEPTGNNTATSASIENISKSGTAEAVTDSKMTGHIWDGVSTGMTGGSGGYGQVANRIGQGNNSLDGIAGQIILGQDDSMSIGVTPEETGLFNAAIIYWKIPVGGRN